MSERTFWMIGADGQVYGPNDAATLRRWIGEARLTAHTQVATGADGPWRPAMDFVEFAPHFPPQPGPRAGETAGVSAAGGGGWGGPDGSGPGGAGPDAPPIRPSEPASAVRVDWPPMSLQVPLLIAGIFNVLHGVGGALGVALLTPATFGFGMCCCPFALVPIFVGVMQIMDFSSAGRTETQRYLDRAQVWGITNIIMVLFAGVVPLICGILQLAFLGEARRRYGMR